MGFIESLSRNVTGGWNHLTGQGNTTNSTAASPQAASNASDPSVSTIAPAPAADVTDPTASPIAPTAAEPTASPIATAPATTVTDPAVLPEPDQTPDVPAVDIAPASEQRKKISPLIKHIRVFRNYFIKPEKTILRHPLETLVYNVGIKSLSVILAQSFPLVGWPLLAFSSAFFERVVVFNLTKYFHSLSDTLKSTLGSVSDTLKRPWKYLANKFFTKPAPAAAAISPPAAPVEPPAPATQDATSPAATQGEAPPPVAPAATPVGTPPPVAPAAPQVGTPVPAAQAATQVGTPVPAAPVTPQSPPPQ